jgi:hypothetical protein
MTDGTSVEVPYYWEENGEVKFDLAGGVAGFPRSQIASIQEVVAAKEFDPQVLLGSTNIDSSLPKAKAFQDLVSSKLQSQKRQGTLSKEEGIQVVEQAEISKKKPRSGGMVYAPKYKVEGNFSEVVRSAEGDRIVLVMRNILVSKVDLKGHPFLLTLYDGSGNVINKKPCEVVELETDQKTLRKLELRGHIYAVVASVDLDPKIARYDISTSQR